MRVALFVTCLVDALYPQVGQATVRLLERLGCEVTFPAGQTCCGQMHLNSGYRAAGVRLARHQVEAFAGSEVVVAPSASCVACVRHSYPELVGEAGGARLPAAAGALAGRTYELAEFLLDVLQVHDVGAYYPHRVTYHPSCHGLRALGLGERPRRLLEAVAGLELVDLPDSQTCCGFGGTFALTNPEVSTAMLADKLAAVAASGAEVITAQDSSCLMHIGGGLARLHAGVRPVHLAEILASTRDDR